MGVRYKFYGRYACICQFYATPASRYPLLPLGRRFPRRRVSKRSATSQTLLTKSRRYHALHTNVDPTSTNSTRTTGAVGRLLRSYRNSESSARDLVSSIWNILDQKLDTSATLVNMIVDLLDEEDKKEDLLTAWDSFKIEVCLSPQGQ